MASRPRQSVLDLFDPLTLDTTPTKSGRSVALDSTTDKENVTPNSSTNNILSDTNVSETVFFKRTYSKSKFKQSMAPLPLMLSPIASDTRLVQLEETPRYKARANEGSCELDGRGDSLTKTCTRSLDQVDVPVEGSQACVTSSSSSTVSSESGSMDAHETGIVEPCSLSPAVVLIQPDGEQSTVSILEDSHAPHTTLDRHACSSLGNLSSTQSTLLTDQLVSAFALSTPLLSLPTPPPATDPTPLSTSSDESPQSSAASNSIKSLLHDNNFSEQLQTQLSVTSRISSRKSSIDLHNSFKVSQLDSSTDLLNDEISFLSDSDACSFLDRSDISIIHEIPVNTPTLKEISDTVHENGKRFCTRCTAVSHKL